MQHHHVNAAKFQTETLPKHRETANAEFHRANRLQAENERLRDQVEMHRKLFAESALLAVEWERKAEKAEAERDEARAQMAFSQMEMRDKAAKLCSWHSETLVTTIKRLPVSIDAQSAFEAYGREKVREGMQRAAELVSHSAYGTAYWAILAEMEDDR